jgi:hypothetical protein
VQRSLLWLGSNEEGQLQWKQFAYDDSGRDACDGKALPSIRDTFSPVSRKYASPVAALPELLSTDGSGSNNTEHAQ